MSDNHLMEWFYRQVLLYKDNMYRFAFSILHDSADCEDAVSNAIIRAHDHIHQLRKKDSFRIWFAKIVRNESLRIIKEHKRTFSVEEKPIVSEQMEPCESIDVQKAMSQLPIDRRTVITLYYICDYSVSDIAMVLQLPIGTVKSRLSRARSELKELLGGNEYEK